MNILRSFVLRINRKVNTPTLPYIIPDNIYKNCKEKFLTYYKTSYARQGYMNGFCKLTFIFYKDQIDTWKYDGNLCNDFADTIGLQ